MEAENIEFCQIAQLSQHCWDSNVGRNYYHISTNIHAKYCFEIQKEQKDISVFDEFLKNVKIASNRGRFEVEVKTWIGSRFTAIMLRLVQISAQQSQQQKF